MNTEEFNQNYNTQGSGSGEQKSQRVKEVGKDKLQEYGREGLGPIMELFNRYGQDMVGYVRQIGLGLEKGGQSLRSDSDEGSKEERQMVASWFEEGSSFINKLERQLSEKSSDELLEFVERQGREHPASLFATSLIAGSVLGRVGKHAVQSRSETGASASSESRSVGAAQTRPSNEFPGNEYDPQLDPRVDTPESAGEGHVRDVSGAPPSEGVGYRETNEDQKKV